MPSSVPASGGAAKAAGGGSEASVKTEHSGLGSALLRGLRFRAVVPAGSFDPEPNCNLQEILDSLFIFIAGSWVVTEGPLPVDTQLVGHISPVKKKRHHGTAGQEPWEPAWFHIHIYVNLFSI